MDGLDDLLDRMTGQPLLLWTAGLIGLFLLVAIIKRVLSIIVLCSALLMMYLIYVTYFEEQYPLPEIEELEPELWKRTIESWFDSKAPADANASPSW